jgi:manganese-dependent inorganic pyrophosphatase
MKQDVIYITGHQHPDTDSIVAAIGYAFFKRANGVKAIPCRLGKIGTETRYLLDRFGFPEPMLLEDARVKMSEIEIDEPTTIMPDKTIYEAIQVMHGAGKQTCGVVDEENRVVGMLTMNDIALVAMGDTAETEKLLEDVCEEDRERLREVLGKGSLIRWISQQDMGEISFNRMRDGKLKPYILQAIKTRSSDDHHIVIGVRPK